MKKLLFLLCVLVGVGTISAKSWKVTLNVYTEYKIVDNATKQELKTGIESEQCHTYTVDAPTQDEAKFKAYEKCSGACRSGWNVVDYNYSYNGKNCTKSVRQVADRSSADVVN